MHKYDDIIGHPHYRHPEHEPMSLDVRAAQFSPFSALDGLDEAIDANSLKENS